jgi:hypothetical protein
MAIVFSAWVEFERRSWFAPIADFCLFSIFRE